MSEENEHYFEALDNDEDRFDDEYDDVTDDDCISGLDEDLWE